MQLNLPNLMSLFRLIMVPFFPIAFFSGDEKAPLYAALIYVAAVITDVLDGYIARKYNLITKTGKVLDPLADKLMSFTVVVCLTAANIIQYWVVIILFLKEVLMGAGTFLLYRKVKDIIPSNFLGKGATALFFLVCVALILFRSIPNAISTALISLALAMAIAAFASYVWKFGRILQGNKKV